MNENYTPTPPDMPPDGQGQDSAPGTGFQPPQGYGPVGNEPPVPGAEPPPYGDQPPYSPGYGMQPPPYGSQPPGNGYPHRQPYYYGGQPGNHYGPPVPVQPPYAPPAPDPKKQFRKLLRGNSNAVGFALLLNFIIGLVLVVVLGFISGFISMDLDTFQITVDDQANSYHISNLVTYIISFVLPGLLIWVVTRIPLKVAFPAKETPFSLMSAAACFNLGAVLVGVTLSTMLSAVLEILFGLVPTMADLSLPTDPVGLVTNLLMTTVFAALCEEFVFRGLIMQSLRRFGDGFALVASALLFAFAHGNLVQGPNAFISGLVIGFFVLRTGSIWTGVVMHFVNNSLAVGSELLFRQIPGGEDMYWLLFLLYIMLGIVGLVIVLTQYRGLFGRLPKRLPVSEGWKFKHLISTPGFILYFLSVVGLTILNFE